MEFLREAGPFGPLAVVLFIAGLAVVVRSRSAASAAPFILGILATGQLGQGLGQHAVRDALAGAPELARKVELLNIGTGEASSALLISGACALILCVVAGALAFAERKNA